MTLAAHLDEMNSFRNRRKKNSLRLSCQVGVKLPRTASATELGSLRLILQMQRLRTQGNPRMYAASNEWGSLEAPRHHVDRSQK